MTGTGSVAARLPAAEPLAERAAALERAGEWSAAYELYQQMFREAIDGGDPAGAADALRGQSRICQQRRGYDDAEEFAELSREIAERNGLPREAARAMNTLAAIRLLKNDLSGAVEQYNAVVERATDCGDDALIGWVCQNLGVIANVRGELREARARYLECVAASVRSGDATSAITAYNNLGIICADLEEWTQSELYFHRGMEIAEKEGNVAFLATLCANLAEPLICTGEYERAEASLARAEQLAERVGNHRVAADIARLRGLGFRLRGDHDTAEAWLTKSFDLAEAHDAPLERAEALEALAALRWAQNRGAAAFALLRQARAGFDGIAAAGEVARLDRLADAWRATLAENGGGE
jgi:tetratricopeptide (TPR) repeat protein